MRLCYSGRCALPHRTHSLAEGKPAGICVGKSMGTTLCTLQCCHDSRGAVREDCTPIQPLHNLSLYDSSARKEPTADRICEPFAL